MNKILVLSILLLAGCNSQNQTENSTEKNITDSVSTQENNNAVTTNVSRCYAWNIKKDSALLKLNISGS